MTSIVSENTDELFSLIHSEMNELGRRTLAVSNAESEPLYAIFNNPIYSLVKNRFQLVNRQIEQLDPSNPCCAKVQQVWSTAFGNLEKGLYKTIDDFAEEAQEITGLTQRDFILTVPEDNPFYETDLIVFRQDYQGELPVNGLLEDAFYHLTELMKAIAQDQTNITIQAASDIKKEILNSLAVLLSREKGRELILSLATDKSDTNEQEILITDGPKSQAWRAEKNSNQPYKIELNLKEGLYVTELPDGTKVSETVPREITLAHELIHIRHFMNGAPKKETRHLEHRLFTDSEEQRTIIGRYLGLADDAINENSIRASFLYHPRWGHSAGVPSTDPLAVQLRMAAEKNITGDIQRILKTGTLNFSSVNYALNQSILCENHESTLLLYRAYKELEQTVPQEFLIRMRCADPIVCACRCGSLKTLAWLIEQDPNQDFVDEKGRSYLHLACENLQKTNFLLDLGWNPNQVDGEGKTALDHLFNATPPPADRFAILQAFMESGAHPIPPEALFAAIEAGNLALVRALLERGVPLESRDAEGNTPLLSAIERENRELTVELIRNGADLFVENSQKQNPLSLAFGGCFDFLQFIHSEIAKQEPSIVDLVSKEQQNDGASEEIALRLELFKASQLPLFELSALLMELKKRGLNVNFINENGDSPLLYAVKTGASLETIKLLLKAGALINLNHPVTGNTSLHEAATTYQLHSFDFLLGSGGEPSLKNANQLTPFEILLDDLFAEELVVQSMIKLNVQAIRSPRLTLDIFEELFSRLDQNNYTKMVANIISAKNHCPELFDLFSNSLLKIALEKEFSEAVCLLLESDLEIDLSLEEEVLAKGTMPVIQSLLNYKLRNSSPYELRYNQILEIV